MADNPFGILGPSRGFDDLALAVVTAFLIYFIVISVVFWVLESIGLMRMAKKTGFRDPWLAWIPGASLYVFMVVAGEKQRKLGIAYLFLSTLGFIVPIVLMYAGLIPLMVHAASNPFMFRPDMGSVFATAGLVMLGYFMIIMLAIAVAVIRYILQFHIFRRFKPNVAVVFLVLSIIFGLGPIFTFAASFGTPDRSESAPPAQTPTFTPPPAA